MATIDASLSRVINGKYRLLAILGQGAMGVVYRADQLDAEGHPLREVALKTIKYDSAIAEGATKRFVREVQVAMQLRSPHIVTVYDSGRDEAGQLYYVMESIKGQTLQALLRTQRPLPIERAVNIAEQMCEGLVEAHGLPEPVIHRDLKPANIFIEQQAARDWVRIADFGIAKVLGEQTTELTAAGIVGTPQYMAPEQWHGGEEIDARTDLYALGVVLYEMVSGRVPSRADNMASLMHKHIAQAPPPLPPHIPPAVRSLVMRLLAKRPEERPRDALTVRHALAESRRPDKKESPLRPEGGQGTDLEETQSGTGGREPFPEVQQEEQSAAVLRTRVRTRGRRPSTPATSPPGIGKGRRGVVGATLACVLFGVGLWWSHLLPAFLSSEEMRAVRQYRQAAEQGDALAQFNLGVLYAEGQGVTRDETEAVRWYRKAAEQGNAEAQNNLGVLYAQGRGVSQDFAEAARWYRKAAEQGSAAAQNNLGLLYAQGSGVSRDVAEAARWYRRAAEQGNANAQYNLGMLYFHGQIGEGGSASDAEAANWYRQAAEQGHRLAQNGLGQLYERGRGVAKDVTEAARWYRRAAEQGDPGARERLKKILGVDPVKR